MKLEMYFIFLPVIFEDYNVATETLLHIIPRES